MIQPWMLKGCAAAVLLLAAWAHGHHVGAEAVTDDWTASDRARESAEIAAQRENARQAQAAATDYESARARSAAAVANARADLRNALQRPICPPAGPTETDHVQTLDALPVPAAAVDRLRRAGGDGSAG